ncbi:MAG TPA: 23S rRNA (pseudouridine(1915)-N(3))-methyltransferase RlmH [Firmicutes bacterium]|jgi:23S rRNA (pseudouridine1915-N3)-methyltransferase|nr:23S rRNA (pseudouridine(1915)-N(3))-methyltransferase RlmH [Bacillota bacterium]
MHFAILAVGKIKEQYFQRAVDEYIKRLRPYARVTVREVKDEKTPDGKAEAEAAAVREREARRLETLLHPQTYLVALDRRGRQLTSPELAALLDRLATEGKSHFTFLIGGSLGLAPLLLEKADLVLSFSELTFPHQLFRVMLLEQLYRACKINRGEPYHK